MKVEQKEESMNRTMTISELIEQVAFTNKLIFDDTWMKMLRVRNQLAHDYDGSFAAECFQEIIKVYCPLFEEMREYVKKYYEKE